jgi:hypothetical protein
MDWEGGILLFILGSNLGGVGPERGLRGAGRRGWCEEWARRTARTILLLHIISARPSKQFRTSLPPLILRTFLKVYGARVCLAPAWGIFARTVPGVVPRRCTPGFHRSPPRVGAISPAIYPCPTLGFDPAGDSIYDKSHDR